MVSEKPWGLESVLRLLAGIFFSIIAGSLLVYWLGPGGLSEASEQLRPFVYLINTVCFQGVTLILAGFFLRQNGLGWTAAFGFSSARLGRHLALAVLAFVVFVPCGLALQKLVVTLMTAHELPVESQVTVQILQKQIPLLEKVLFGICTIVVAPAAEEILFRGILYPTIKQSGHPHLALWGVSLLFGVIHNNLAAALPLALFGVVLTLLYEATGNLASAMVTHGLFNAMNFVLLMAHWDYHRLWQELWNLARRLPFLGA